MKIAAAFTATFILVSAAADLCAKEPIRDPDKSQYHLFNPTPDDQLREMVGDRPDGTESPTTVDAGHVQIEMSFVDWARDRDGGAEFEAITTGATNVRIGLLNDLELQILFDIYSDQEFEAPRFPTETAEGFSDITLRPKLNIWGNEGGSTALALMPAVKIPTGTALSKDEVEGAIIVPFGMDLTDRLGLGIMAEVDWVYDANEDGYDTELFHTVVLGYDVTDSLGVYIEYIGIAGDAPYQSYLSSGMTLGLNPNTALDVGAVVGMNDDSQDIQVFSGITVRF